LRNQRGQPLILKTPTADDWPEKPPVAALAQNDWDMILRRLRVKGATAEQESLYLCAFLPHLPSQALDLGAPLLPQTQVEAKQRWGGCGLALGMAEIEESRAPPNRIFDFLKTLAASKLLGDIGKREVREDLPPTSR
jgi:hypothetical protein